MYLCVFVYALWLCLFRFTRVFVCVIPGGWDSAHFVVVQVTQTMPGQAVCNPNSLPSLSPSATALLPLFALWPSHTLSQSLFLSRAPTGNQCMRLADWKPAVTPATNDAAVQWVTGFGSEVKWAVNRQYPLRKIPFKYQSMAYLQGDNNKHFGTTIIKSDVPVIVYAGMHYRRRAGGALLYDPVALSSR